MNEQRERTRRGTEDRSRHRAERRRRRIKWAVIVVVVIAALCLVKPAYRWTKQRRADQLAAQGAELVTAGKLNEAAGKYRAALQLDPIGYRSLQGAARLATKGNRPEALDLWEQVVRLPACTTADRQDYAAALLGKNKFSAAEKVISPLLINAPDARTLNLAATYAARTSNLPRALEFARLAVSHSSSGDDFAKVQLADLLTKSTGAAERAEAREILWSLAAKPGSYQRTAIEGLARSPDLTTEEAQRVLVRLTDTRTGTVTEALLAADLRLRIEPANAAGIYDKVTEEWGTKDSAEEVGALARWLNGHQQADRVLNLVPPERATLSEPLLVARLDALAGANRWNEIEETLRRPNLPTDQVVVEAFRARSALARNAPLDADLHWDRAIAAAGTDPARLRFVADFAEQSKSPDVALKVYEQLTRLPEEAAFAQASRQRILLQLGAGTAARSAAEKLAGLLPEDPNAQVQLAYLNLLASVDVAASAAKAKALAAKFPDRLAYRVAAALGSYREGDVPAALAQFNGPAIDWQRTPPRWRAVYAAVLIANGDAVGAEKIISTIPREQLAEEERALIGRGPNES